MVQVNIGAECSIRSNHPSCPSRMTESIVRASAVWAIAKIIPRRQSGSSRFRKTPIPRNHAFNPFRKMTPSSRAELASRSNSTLRAFEEERSIAGGGVVVQKTPRQRRLLPSSIPMINIPSRNAIRPTQESPPKPGYSAPVFGRHLRSTHREERASATRSREAYEPRKRWNPDALGNFTREPKPVDRFGRSLPIAFAEH